MYKRQGIYNLVPIPKTSHYESAEIPKSRQILSLNTFTPKHLREGTDSPAATLDLREDSVEYELAC